VFGKVIRYALIFAALVLVGTKLLDSVRWVAYEWIHGNILPMMMIWAGAIAVMVYSRKKTTGFTSEVIRLVCWAVALYTGVVTFLALAPLGIVVSLFGLGISLLVFNVVREPKGFSGRFSQLLEPAGDISIPVLGKPMMSRGAAWFSIDRLKMKALIIPLSLRGAVLDFMRERPLLPVSVTRYEDCDIMIVRTKGEEKVLRQVKLTLSERGLNDMQTLSPFMTNAILGLPLLERAEGVELNEYMVATEENTVKRLLEMWPNRITVFPNRLGLRVIIRNDSAPGFDLEGLPSGREAHILLGRDTTLLPTTGGIEIAGESTA